MTGRKKLAKGLRQLVATARANSTPEVSLYYDICSGDLVCASVDEVEEMAELLDPSFNGLSIHELLRCCTFDLRYTDPMTKEARRLQAEEFVSHAVRDVPLGVLKLLYKTLHDGLNVRIIDCHHVMQEIEDGK